MIRFLTGGLLDKPVIRLTGRLVTLRPPTMQDWSAWAELRSASKNFLTPREPEWPADALTRSTFARRVKRQRNEWNDDLAYSFISFENETGRLVGGLGLGNLRRGVAQSSTLGYWVGERFAKRGYTSDAVRLVLNFAFNELNLHRVEASCLPDNIASRRLLCKLGFIEEGLARSYLRINGAWRDHLLFAVLKDEWQG
ncbi:MAG: GNAT family protein [Rhodospirillaceae bacterium]